MVIHCDNKMTLGVMQTETPRLAIGLRHVDIHSSWLRQGIQEGRITASWIPTAGMPADGFTRRDDHAATKEAPKCFRCNKEGHFATNCPEPIRDAVREIGSEEEAEDTPTEVTEDEDVSESEN